MLICDTHSDTLYSMGVHHVPSDRLMITPELLRKGNISLQTFALWTGGKGNKGDVKGITEAELSQVPVMEAAGLRKVDDPSQVKEGENCFMLSIEGCEMFESGTDAVQVWRDKGVRIAALVWNNENAIGYPAKSGSSKGLTEYGVRVVKEMQRLGIAADTSHLNEAGFYDIFAKTDKPPTASHSCCRALCDHFRNLTDDQLRLMIREGGFVGINFYPAFLSSSGKADCDLIAQHIDHVCQLGGENIVGFGSDFDGIETTPSDLNNAGEMGNLISALRKRGFTEENIENIAGNNLLAYFRRIAV